MSGKYKCRENAQPSRSKEGLGLRSAGRLDSPHPVSSHSPRSRSHDRTKKALVPSTQASHFPNVSFCEMSWRHSRLRGRIWGLDTNIPATLRQNEALIDNSLALEREVDGLEASLELAGLLTLRMCWVCLRNRRRTVGETPGPLAEVPATPHPGFTFCRSGVVCWSLAAAGGSQPQGGFLDPRAARVGTGRAAGNRRTAEWVCEEGPARTEHGSPPGGGHDLPPPGKEGGPWRGSQGVSGGKGQGGPASRGRAELPDPPAGRRGGGAAAGGGRSRWRGRGWRGPPGGEGVRGQPVRRPSSPPRPLGSF